MSEGELIHEVRTRFSNITNELIFLEDPISIVKQVSKILEILPSSWTNDFVTGNETRELDVMTMHTLFEYLQVHEMHKKYEGIFLKGKDKKTDLVDEDDPKKENHDKATSSSEVCGISYMFGHSIGNFSVYKADHLKIVKTAEGKDKERDQVRPKIRRENFFFRALKRDMVAWKKSSSDSDDSERTDNDFMAKSDEEDAHETVTLSYLKRNLNTFYTSKFRKVAIVLLDLISELTSEKDPINNSLDISQDGKIALVAQISNIKSQMIVLEAKNLELKKKMKGELEKSLTWTNSSKILTNLIGQDNNSRRGLGCDKIKSSYNPRSKNVPDVNNLLSENCGRDGNLKKDCPILENFEGSSSNYSKQRKRAEERHVKFVRSENNQENKEMGPRLHAKFVRSDSNMETERKGLGPCYHFSKNTLHSLT
ncbi:uncharacterized protein [Solanum lycopersicum]|uniref:uncharacterized protein n=1 Tax=Solanum lycopersicum TaxID=4081 RepID=UPI003749195E